MCFTDLKVLDSRLSSVRSCPGTLFFLVKLAMARDPFGYEAALHVRMHKFREEDVTDQADDDESDGGFKFPEKPPARQQVSTVHLDLEEGIHGHSLSGEMLFRIPPSRCSPELTAGALLELIAEEMGSTGSVEGVLLQDWHTLGVLKVASKLESQCKSVLRSSESSEYIRILRMKVWSASA